MKFRVPKNKSKDFKIRMDRAVKDSCKEVKDVVWDMLTEIVTEADAKRAVKTHDDRVPWRKQKRLERALRRPGRILDILAEKRDIEQQRIVDERYSRSPEVSVKSLPELPQWVISILRVNGYRRLLDFQVNDAKVKGWSRLWGCKGINEYWVPVVVDAFATALQRARNEENQTV